MVGVCFREGQELGSGHVELEMSNGHSGRCAKRAMDPLARVRLGSP